MEKEDLEWFIYCKADVMIMARKEKVSFWATKKTAKPVKITFPAKGKKVSFKATKNVSEPVKVMFYAKRRKRR